MEERDDGPRQESSQGAGTGSPRSPGADDRTAPRTTESPGGDEAGSGTSRLGVVLGPTVNAVLAPGECFDVLDDSPARAWWIWLWTSVAMLGLALWNLPITRRAFEAMTRVQVEASGREMSAEQLQQAREFNQWISTLTTWASPIFLLVQFLVIAAVIWLVASLMGRSGGFSRAFAVTMGGAVIHPTLYSVYASTILHVSPPEIRRPRDFALMQPSAGLDLLFDQAELASWLLPILQRIDLFNVWWGVVVVIGVRKMLGLRRGQAVTVAVVVWLLTTGIASVGGFFQGLAG